MKKFFVKFRVNELLDLSGETFKKFPGMIISGLMAFLVVYYMIENEKLPGVFEKHINYLLVSALGIVTFFLTDISVWLNKLNLKIRGALYVMNIVILWAIYHSLPQAEHDTFIREGLYVKYALWLVMFHLLVTFLPLWGKKDWLIWNFNLQLLLRFVASFIYSYTILMGVSFALFLIDFLLKVNVDGDLYAKWFFFTSFVLSPWIFAAGVSLKIEDYENYSLPGFLKKFSLYVLLPLLGVYILIFYVYAVKILIQGEWPQGGVAAMILQVSVGGYLIFSILYGLIEQKNTLFKLQRLYFLLLLPLSFVLYLAVDIRVEKYGLTISRLIILFLNVWLVLISIYKLWKPRDLKIVPLSLSVVALLMAFGPLNIVSLSEQSQVNRLKTILEENDLLKNGKIVNELIYAAKSDTSFTKKCQNDGLLNDSLANEVYMILWYLDKNAGFEKVNRFFSQNMDSLIHAKASESKYFNETDFYISTMSICNYGGYRKGNKEGKELNFYSAAKFTVKKIHGYDFMFPVYLYSRETKSILYADSLLKFEVLSEKQKPVFYLRIYKNDSLLVNSTIDMKNFITGLINHSESKGYYDVPQEMMKVHVISDNVKVKIECYDIVVIMKSEEPVIKSFSGDMYVKIENADLIDALMKDSLEVD
ncbi:MAG: hypothetical protein KatS3mg028_1588 [Bacteroidia bacterium]|nr:MAG: hypothetical protein KatS3mg028_1588 [Bacteroidia bacterium]